MLLLGCLSDLFDLFDEAVQGGGGGRNEILSKEIF